MGVLGKASQKGHLSGEPKRGQDSRRKRWEHILRGGPGLSKGTKTDGTRKWSREGGDPGWGVGGERVGRIGRGFAGNLLAIWVPPEADSEMKTWV